MLENNTKIRVIILINELLRGGAQRIVLDIAQNIDRKRFALQVVYLKADTNFPPDAQTVLSELEASGISAVCLSGGPRFSFAEAVRLYTFLRREKPHVLQTFLPYAGILGRVIGRLARVPHITSVQCNLPIAYTKKNYWLDKLTLPLAEVWTGATEGIEQSYGNSVEPFTRKAWQKGRRHFTIVAGVDLPAFDARIAKANREEKRREIGVAKEDTLVMMTARLISWKGHKNLIEAMRLLPASIHLILVGWGPLEAELRAQAEKEGTAGRIHFLGSRNDVIELLAAADIYVQAHSYAADGSVWKGPNTSQMEACAAHIPSVSTAVPLIEALIEDKKTGVLARPNDPRDLARAILFLYEHPDDAKRLAQAARVRVEKHYSLISMIRSYEGLYECAIGLRR
jgi:glycosyltransferase involved in cell wall biosynthesis